MQGTLNSVAMTHYIEANERMPIQSMGSKTRCVQMTSSEPETFTVPTIFKKAPEQINLIELGVCELVSLKEDDPFLYYSIPAIRKAAMHGIDIDEAAFDATAFSTNTSGLSTRSISFESSHGLEIDVTDSDETVDMTSSLCSEVEEHVIEFLEVTRQSRISFESSNLLLSDYLHAIDSVTVSECDDPQNDEDNWLFDCTNFSFDE
ncbi:hypothetical protein ACHAW6_009995 [Cyclotella cf. meneghiniana]